MMTEFPHNPNPSAIVHGTTQGFSQTLVSTLPHPSNILPCIRRKETAKVDTNALQQPCGTTALLLT